MEYWYILIVFFVGVFFLIELPIIIAAFSMAPWVPSRKSDLARIHRLAELEEGEKFYDLGCGDGRVCLYVAKESPEAKIAGLEIAYPLFFWAKVKQWLSGLKNVRLLFRSVFKHDFSDADVVYFFGIPPTLNNQLKRKFEKELRPGARVIVYDIPMEGWDVWKKDQPAGAEIPIYVYKR